MIADMTDNTKNRKDTDCLTPDEIEERADDIAKGLFSGIRKPLDEYVGKRSVPVERNN